MCVYKLDNISHHTLCTATDKGLRGRFFCTLHVHSCALMINICSEPMSTARMSLYSIAFLYLNDDNFLWETGNPE